MATTITGPTPADLKVRTLESTRFAARISRSSPIDFRGAWTGLGPELGAQKLADPDACSAAIFQCSSLSPVAMDWYAASSSIGPNAQVRAPLEELLLQAGDCVTWVYQGSYEGLPHAWPAFVAAVEAGGYPLALGRPCLEIYLERGERPRTELCVPIA